jgi:hypothetical protein
MEKAGKIAEALDLRPQLALQIGGVYAADVDAAALKADRVDQMVEERITTAKDDEGMYAEQRREVIEELLAESLAEGEPAAILDEARQAHTTLNDDGKEQFDALAYTEALREQLLDMQTVSEEELASLGAARVESFRQAILVANADLDARITIDAPSAVDVDDDELVRMKLQLSPQ